MVGARLVHPGAARGRKYILMVISKKRVSSQKRNAYPIPWRAGMEFSMMQMGL